MKDREKTEEKFRQLLKGRKEISNDETEDLRKVYHELLNEKLPEPPDSLDERVYSLLDESSRKAKRKPAWIQYVLSDKESLRVMSRVAAGIILFISGWIGAGLAGSKQGSDKQIVELTREVAGLRQSLVLTMLTQDSPSERIKAVNMAGDMNEIDITVITGMLSVLNNDPNDNVRLVALEALLSYTDYPEVREGLIRSISIQKSPLIQYRLAEIMQSLEEKRSVPEFRKILTDLTLDFSVRRRINETIEILL